MRTKLELSIINNDNEIQYMITNSDLIIEIWLEMLEEHFVLSGHLEITLEIIQSLSEIEAHVNQRIKFSG